jgi:hypothetical protein
MALDHAGEWKPHVGPNTWPRPRLRPGRVDALLQQAERAASARLRQMASHDIFFSFFQRILLFYFMKLENRKEIRKTVKKILEIFFSVIENYTDIYGPFYSVAYFGTFYLYFMQFSVDYETNMD